MKYPPVAYFGAIRPARYRRLGLSPRKTQDTLSPYWPLVRFRSRKYWRAVFAIYGLEELQLGTERHQSSVGTSLMVKSMPL